MSFMADDPERVRSDAQHAAGKVVAEILGLGAAGHARRVLAAKCLIADSGDDPTREGLQETPERFAKAFAHWTSGYDVDPLSVLKSFEDGACDEMVTQSGIPFFSLCEHHLAPFFGVVHIGYVPNKRVVGLSKLSRLVDVFARRLQVQERLTSQIADTLMTGLQAKGVGVVMRARHMCMESRGVQKVGVITATTAIRGVIRHDSDARSEFLNSVAAAGAHQL